MVIYFFCCIYLFDFEPKIMFISGEKPTQSNVLRMFGVLDANGAGLVIPPYLNTQNYVYGLNVSVSGTTIAWHTAANDAQYQLNAIGYTFVYTAIG